MPEAAIARWKTGLLAASMTAAQAGTSATALAFTDQGNHARPGPPVGNAIFIHPDGTALNHWHAGRNLIWCGPDGALECDRLPEIVVYRGHMSDRLTGTSNGGATTHAFGVEVQGRDSSIATGESTSTRCQAIRAASCAKQAARAIRSA